MDLIANKKESNSLGKKDEKGQILNPPYEIEKCGQIVAFPGKRLLTYDDVINRVDAYFDIGIYIINMYEKDSAETLIQSIETQTLEGIPEIIQGSGSCLKIEDKKSNIRKSFSMCLPDKETAKQIQNIFNEFLYNCNQPDVPCDHTESIFAVKDDGTKRLISTRLVKRFSKMKFGKDKDKLTDCLDDETKNNKENKK